MWLLLSPYSSAVQKRNLPQPLAHHKNFTSFPPQPEWTNDRAGPQPHPGQSFSYMTQCWELGLVGRKGPLRPTEDAGRAWPCYQHTPCLALYVGARHLCLSSLCLSSGSPGFTENVLNPLSTHLHSPHLSSSKAETFPATEAFYLC